MKGRRIQFSAAELAFVEAHGAMNRRALHAAFVAEYARDDVTLDHIKALCTRYGWTTGRQRWSDQADAQLRELYPHMPTADVARRLGHTELSTYQHAQKLGLRKTAAYLASPAACRLRRGDNVGAAYRFKKGQTPMNKGKPMPFHPNSAATRFKKGNRPSTMKWLGHERLSKDGYVEVSVQERNPHTGFERRYVHKHRWLWEKANGKIPAGFALKCLGDKLNTDPSNWALIPRAVLLRLNSRGRNYDGAPAELKPTIMALAKLEHAAAKSRARSA